MSSLDPESLARESCGGKVLDVALHGETLEAMAAEGCTVRLHISNDGNDDYRLPHGVWEGGEGRARRKKPR